MPDVLAIDPAWDLVTQYGDAFRKKFVFSNFKKTWANHNLFVLSGRSAAQPAVDNLLAANNVAYISAMGHGLYDSFTGHNNLPIWSAAQPLHPKLAGTIVHLLSCQTGGVLGRAMVQHGARAFWGYTVNFTFFHSNPPPAQLDQDTTPEPFLKMDCIIDRGILGSITADKIYNSVTQYWAQVYSQLPSYQRAVFLDNYVHLVCPATTWGSVGAVI
jgi:hypothetical protein